MWHPLPAQVAVIIGPAGKEYIASHGDCFPSRHPQRRTPSNSGRVGWQGMLRTAGAPKDLFPRASHPPWASAPHDKRSAALSRCSWRVTPPPTAVAAARNRAFVWASGPAHVGGPRSDEKGQERILCGCSCKPGNGAACGGKSCPCCRSFQLSVLVKHASP